MRRRLKIKLIQLRACFCSKIEISNITENTDWPPEIINAEPVLSPTKATLEYYHQAKLNNR